MKIVKTDFALAEAVKVLKRSGVLIYPTDTLYGLGCDATSGKAMKRIFRIKGRGFQKPFSVCVADLEQASKFVKLDGYAMKMAEKFLPGPLTLVLPGKRKMRYISKNGKIAIRIPGNSFCINLVKKFGKPVVSTSANVSGKKPPSRFSEIDEKLMEKCDLIIDGGDCKYKKPSTVVDLGLKKIIRRGAISEKMLDFNFNTLKTNDK